jgi:hypothetical protein
MNRKAHTKPVTPQMYRHFAMVTVAATMTVALFNNGESRDAVAREVAVHQRSATPAGSALVRRDGKPPAPKYSSDDVGFDADFGQPTDRVGATPQDSGYSPADYVARPNGGAPTGFTRYGVSAEAWATLTPEMRKVLIAREKARLAAAATPERERQVDALLAASRARSGAAASTND